MSEGDGIKKAVGVILQQLWILDGIKRKKGSAVYEGNLMWEGQLNLMGGLLRFEVYSLLISAKQVLQQLREMEGGLLRDLGQGWWRSVEENLVKGHGEIQECLLNN